MIQIETRTNRHELSVALIKTRLFWCYKTHLDCNRNQKRKSKKKKKKKNLKKQTF